MFAGLRGQRAARNPMRPANDDSLSLGEERAFRHSRFSAIGRNRNPNPSTCMVVGCDIPQSPTSHGKWRQ
jgi:hypothetical protein